MPVERLVRIVLIAQAVIRLLMTPDGRSLLRETPKAMPERRRPAPDEMAGAAPAPSSATPQPSRKEASERQARRCGFRVLRWMPGEDIAASPPALHPRPELYDEAARVAEPYDEAAQIDGAALQLHPSLARQMPRPPGRSALAFARRIDALSRVIGNPEPAIRRLMRLFARLPHGLIDPAGFGVRFTGNWRHCGPEYRRALMHSERLFTVFNIVTEPG